MTQQRPHILVVDDDPKSRVAVKAVLEDFDIEIVEAESGEEALHQVLRYDFAMIILDVQLAGINGFETAEAIRQRELSREIPILFLTGYEKSELQVTRGFSIGAVDYMVKPFVAESLRANVKYQLELLRALEAERETAERLSTFVSDLERSNQELDDFAYIASHDLKEPLRGVAINANFLLNEIEEPSQRKRLTRMVALCDRMHQMISDLLFYSGLSSKDEGQFRVEPRRIIDGILNGLREFLEERGGTVSMEADLPEVQCARARVDVVFRNLIVNAIKYNTKKRKVVKIGFRKSVSLRGWNGKNVFYVKDNGIGINPDDSEKVFKIFSRLNNESEYGPGTGAGLSFVKKIIEGHGGEIVFSENKTGGTTFYFTLPLA